MIDRILVLCTGNICRSPMAEGMFRQALQGRAVSSAGLGALVGWPADPHGVALMRQHGIDISQHRARQLEGWMIDTANLVLVMDMEQKRYVERLYPVCQGKAYRLGEHGRYDILDPYQLGPDAFRESAERIRQGVLAWAARINTISGRNMGTPNFNLTTSGQAGDAGRRNQP